MHVYGVFCQRCGPRDLRYVQLFNITKQKDRALIVRKGLRRLPNLLNLLLDNGARFGGNSAIRPIQNFSAVHLMRPFPELEAPALNMIAEKVYGDAHKPRVHAAIPSKLLSAPVSIPKAILSERLGKVHIAEGCKQEAKNPGPVPFNDPVEVLEFQGRIFKLPA